MKTISQYREDIKALMKKLGDIDAKVQGENRDLTEAEIALKNEMLDTVEDIGKTVATLERQDRIARILEAPEQPATVARNQRPAVPDNPERFSRFGQQLAAVMNAGMPGGRIDPRLYNATGLNETSPSDGGLR